MEQEQSNGRIEVAPGVLTTIARLAIRDVEGVAKLTSPPADVAHLFKRSGRQDGVVLQYQDGDIIFDIYALCDPHANLLKTSRALQTAVIEAIDKMVGLPVAAVNIHVEDVVYEPNEAV